MKAVQNNPYRTIGMLVGATPREQERQVRRLKQFIEAEQDPADDFSFPKLGGGERKMEQVNDAISKLNLNSDKMSAALFWFWNGNPITDEAAFDSLKEGDMETAYQIWDKLITTRYDDIGVWKPVTEKNYSAFHNCSLINIIKPNGSLYTAVAANLYFLESDLVHKFISSVVDETYKTTKKELQLLFLNQFYLEIETNKYFSLDEFIDIINMQDFSARQDFLKILIQKFTEQIENRIERTKINRKANKANAAIFGQELYTTTEELLNQLYQVIDTDDTRYSLIADKIANEILQCSIEYFNESQENDSDNDYIEIAMKLVKQAETISVGRLISDRIKDSISTLEEMKNREVLEAIQLLKSIKSAYEENENKINQHVKILEKDLDILTGRKTINYNAVTENIRNSIDWKKVNELFASILSNHKLNKIKSSNNSKLKLEFIDLANWIQVKALYSSTIEDVLSKYEKIPPKLPFKILSSVVTNTNNKPLYSKFVRYIGLTLNVQPTAEKTVTFYLKYITPNGNINRNSKVSPNRYTLSSTQDLTINTTSISLPGWGNSDKCSFDIGEHRIEVYVDEYLIHSKNFLVDLAPSERMEIELKKAEEKLKEIQNTQFFKAELDTSHSQLDKIKGWKLLRSQSDKEMQIKEQEILIRKLIAKADREKASQIGKQEAIINEIKYRIQNAEY